MIAPPPVPRTRIWPTATLAALAAIIAVVALVVALSRPETVSGITPETPIYTAAERAAAHKELCETYEPAARAAKKETNNAGPALAGVAVTNGASMLEKVAAIEALEPKERSVALALADAYRNMTVMASLVAADDPEWQSTLDDANAKASDMKEVCDGD